MAEVPFRLAPQEYDPAVPIDQLIEHPENYNEGDVGAILSSVDKHGFIGAVFVQKSTRYIVIGNHRHRSAVLRGAETIPVFWLDIDDDEARRILVDDNWSTHLATFNEAQLVALLTPLAKTPGGLPATLTGDDLDDLIQHLSPPDLGKLGGGDGGGDGGSGEDLWPVLRFKLSPENRDAFYEITDDADDKTDEGRLLWLMKVASGEPA